MPHSLSLRPLRVDDAEAMAAVLADPDLYTYTGGTPPGEEELRQRYAILARGRSEDGAEDWANWIVVLEPEGRPVGYVQATIPSMAGSNCRWTAARRETPCVRASMCRRAPCGSR